MLIFERSRPGRRSPHHAPAGEADLSDLPQELLRSDPPLLPEVSELDAVRHYTRLSRRPARRRWAS